MYSGFAVTKFSGRVMGAHQQVDRLARRHLSELLNENDRQFPQFKEIVRFEGKNGPDGIKIKSPARNEPWHFIDPLGEDHNTFLSQLRQHYDELVNALKTGDSTRAAFEAAWLAHTAVDGMTPAHHFPYEAAVEELRGGKGRHTRTTKREKAMFKGETVGETIGNMYRVYGPKGLFTAHHLFEFGVMLLLRPLRLPDARPTPKDLRSVDKLGPGQYFIRSAREVAALGLYDMYLEKGWTTALSNKIRHHLAPVIVRTVTVLWYAAYKQAENKRPK